MSTFAKRTAARAALVGCMIPVCFARPGDGIHAGTWDLRPFVELNGVHDSNINQTPTGTDDDLFLDSTLGLRAGRTTYALDLGVLTFLSRRTYADATDKNFGSAGELVKVKYGNRDQARLEADQSFRQVEDTDAYGAEAAVGGISPDSVLDISSRQRRNINQAGLSFGKNLTDKTDLDVGYRFDAVDYDSRGLLDLSSHDAQFETSHHLTDKTAALLTVKAGLQDNGVADDMAEYYAARAGLKTHGTDKLSFKTGVGAQQFARPNGDGDDSRLSYDLSAIWVASDKLSLQAGGRNGTTLSSLYADNAADFDVVWLGAAYRVLPTLSLSVNGAYRVDDYIDPVSNNGTSVAREDKGKSVRLRADYLTPAQFLRIYSEATHEAVTSTIDDYDETRVSLGFNLQY